MYRVILLLGLLGLAVVPATAQDPTKVDPDHYKVEFENDQVRIVRITYGAGEKSVMHEHPDAVAVFLVDQQVKFHLPDGEVVDDQRKEGEAAFFPAGPHLPENVGDKELELVLVELKSK